MTNTYHVHEYVDHEPYSPPKYRNGGLKTYKSAQRTPENTSKTSYNRIIGCQD